jgi:hypothetical protein
MLMDPAVPRCAEPVFAAFGMPAVKNISAPSVPASARCHGKLLPLALSKKEGLLLCFMCIMCITFSKPALPLAWACGRDSQDRTLTNIPNHIDQHCSER